MGGAVRTPEQGDPLFQAYINARDSVMAAAHVRMDLFLDDCPDMTPIEERMLYALIARFGEHKRYRLRVQVPILRYIADFCIDDRLDKIPPLVIECDGHEFHERTKEQAQKDKRRDRDIQKAGYQVFRFTGSEIYRNADACALDVDHAIGANWARELKRITRLSPLQKPL